MLNKRKLGRLMLHSTQIAGQFVPPLLRAYIKQRLLDPPAFVLSPADRQLLIEHYADDIQKLAHRLSWDLSDWLGDNLSDLPVEPVENDILSFGSAEQSYRRAA
jgi:hypothetical protein